MTGVAWLRLLVNNISQSTLKDTCTGTGPGTRCGGPDSDHWNHLNLREVLTQLQARAPSGPGRTQSCRAGSGNLLVYRQEKCIHVCRQRTRAEYHKELRPEQPCLLLTLKTRKSERRPGGFLTQQPSKRCFKCSRQSTATSGPRRRRGDCYSQL